MTNAEIEILLTEIEGREQKAMPGPWAWSCAPYNYDPKKQYSPWLISESFQGRDVIYGDYIECSEPNADFISHSRQDIPALVKLVRELMQQLNAERKGHQEELRDAMRDAREAAAEAGWKERQGGDYGSY